MKNIITLSLIVLLLLCLQAFVPQKVSAISVGECGCKFSLSGTGCRENLAERPCPELKKCDCFTLGQTAPFVCKGRCVDDPNDPHCDPGTGKKADGVRTAIGCIPVNNMQGVVNWIFPKVIGLASGIAFLLMVLGSFQIITSSGDPKKTQAGSELITSALSGLLFIILSIFLLKLIGVDILKIPGFGN